MNPPSSDYFGATKRQALAALEAYPGGLQIGGGITAENAEEYLEAGASHVIVTSYVFLDGEVRLDRMERLKIPWKRAGGDRSELPQKGR